MSEKSQLIVRVDPDLKKKVQYQAQTEGKSTSEVVRELLVGYLRDRDQETYINGLWDRIGDRLREGGFGPDDVDRAIGEVRAARRA